MSYHQIIYNRLRQAGMTEAGALGCLGNWECESNCEPNRVQGDFSPYRTVSKQYVSDVTAGRISREQFGKDGKGFGIYQLTYFTRKLGYYDFWKKSGKALDDVELQVDYALLELQRDYGSLYQYLCHTDDIAEAATQVCCKFERPEWNNVNARYAAALRIREEIDLSGTAVAGENATTQEAEVLPYKPELIPATEYWPPRTVDKNMDGDDVVILKAVLAARGFGNFHADISGFLDGQTDRFDDDTEQAVKQFQTAYKLDVDGVVGPKTWAKLLEQG